MLNSSKNDWRRRWKCKVPNQTQVCVHLKCIEMFYLNTIEQLLLFVDQLDQLEVCLPYSRLLTGIKILGVFQNLSWNSNKTSLVLVYWTENIFIDRFVLLKWEKVWNTLATMFSLQTSSLWCSFQWC